MIFQPARTIMEHQDVVWQESLAAMDSVQMAWSQGNA